MRKHHRQGRLIDADGVKADVIRTFGVRACASTYPGPMTGYPNLNRPACAMAAEKVEAAGMIPVNPHDRCEPNGIGIVHARADVSDRGGCDAILMIDGWQVRTARNGAGLKPCSRTGSANRAAELARRD